MLSSGFHLSAQTVWSHPEAEQLYLQGSEYLKKGNFALASNAYLQAIDLEPGHLEIYKELGQSYYFAGKYKEALEAIAPLFENKNADAESYQIAAASLTAQKETRQARKRIEEGLGRYPNSGLLYFEYGRLYDDSGSPEDALRQWLKGISMDPGYRVNYYEVARLYAQSKEPWWALIYGETFVNLERVTPRADNTRKMLLEVYKSLFLKAGTNNIMIQNIPANPSTFEQAVLSTFREAAPAVMDGVTTENLTMLRARFMTVWKVQYAAKYPHTLFNYWDQLLGNGYFDVYNQWLFAKAENDGQYKAWQSFHGAILPAFQAWAGAHPLQPTSADDYNKKKIKDLFPAKRSPSKR